MGISHIAKVDHELKTDPDVFQRSWEGRKKYEIRFNDRDYKQWDRLLLRETFLTGETMKRRGTPCEYTGRWILAVVTDVLEGPIYGLKEGWVILSISVEGRASQYDVPGRIDNGK